MQSSTSLKAACLTAGLVTAWSPLHEQTARGDTVNLSFNLVLNGSPNPSIHDAYVGFVGSDANSPAFLGPNDYSSGDSNGLSPQPPTSGLEQFVTVGLDPFNNVAVSFSNQYPMYPDPNIGDSWSTYFGSTDETAFAQALQDHDSVTIHDFISSLFVRTDSAGFTQALESTADLFRFVNPNNPDNPMSDSPGAQPFGTLYAEVATSDTGPSPVPLPSAFLMGGALFGLLACGHLAVVRARRREAI